MLLQGVFVGDTQFRPFAVVYIWHNGSYALLTGVYGNVLRALKDTTDGTKPVPIAHAAMAGSISGVINCLASCPIELVKTRLQMQIGMPSLTRSGLPF
jgi:hypothetical protein